MYRLTLTPEAEGDLARLDSKIEQRILDKLKWLCQNCEIHRHKALTVPHKGKFSYRITRDYRILYTFDRQTRELTISRIQHRSRVY
jgi:mRNA-degrading endonuclease RelE of RelBE toxin-antitoxin system